MQRYFAEVVNNRVILNDEDIHHVLHVMRMRKGDEIEVVADRHLYAAIIDNINPLEISVNYEIPSHSEINNDIVLFYTLAKGDKIDLVVQKATELGAKKVVLLSSERCVVKWEEKEVNKKLERYKKIAKEASEQSHRLIVPDIIGVYQLSNIPNDLLCDLNLFAYEKKAGNTGDLHSLLKKAAGSVSVLVGPEGGFSEKEAEMVEKKYGFIPISLGKRILRSETGAIYALSVIGFYLEK